LASCTPERSQPSSLDPDVALLGIAKSLCAAPRTSLRQYLADQRRPNRLVDSMRMADTQVDTLFSRFDSTLAGYIRTGLIIDESVMVEALATQDAPAKLALVSMQGI